jgi:hypothetical protein
MRFDHRCWCSEIRDQFIGLMTATAVNIFRVFDPSSIEADH